MATGTDSVLTAAGTTAKYNIPVSHLDFDYIKSCTNTKELEKIYLTLKSGDEGFYPELQQFCEDKLRELNPDSRILRKENPAATKGDLDHSERQELDKDLKDWSSGMKGMEETLKMSQHAENDLPPVRSGVITLTSEGAKVTKPAAKKPVKPRDYRDWDKVDIEKELEKVDQDDKPKGRSFVDGKEIKDIPEHVETKGLSESEKLMKSNREKDKGNEAFKAGDFKEAIVYYSRSISLQPTAASYNNRALAYLKTEDWMKALTDTNKVLKLEPENLKALLRQATARKGLKQFDKAKTDLEKVLEKEPNNKRAQELLKEVEKEKQEKKSKGRRMVIEDVDEAEDETENVLKDSASVVKSEVEDSDEEKVMVNGFAEPTELHEKNKDNPLVNGPSGHAGGDTEKSKDIWTADEIDNQNKQEVGSNKQENTQVRSENTTKGAINVMEETNEKHIVIENKSDSEIETKNDLIVEQEARYIETSEEQENEEDQSESEEKSEENSESEEKTTDVKHLKRPVFYQRPFPDNCVKLREEGNALFRNGQYGEAISIYTKLIEILENVNDQEVNLSLIYSNRAACQLKTGDLPGTVRDCTRSLQLIPHSVKPLLRRAMAYENLERPRLAYIDYRHVLLLDGRIDQAHIGTKRCQQQLHQKDGPKWREKFQLPCVSPWEIPEIYDVGGKPTSQVVFNNPVPTPQQTNSAVQSISSTQKTEELKQEEKIEVKELSASEKFEKLKGEGNEFVKKGEYSEAVNCYNKCMEVLPNQLAVYTNRALCFIKLNKAVEAEKDCTDALLIEQDNVKALFRRAQARKMLGHNREGIEDLNQLLKVDPKNTAAKKEMELMKKLWREELDKLKKDMPISLKNEKEHKAKVKNKTEPKQRKRMVIEEVESDEDSQGNKTPGSPSKSKQETKEKVEEKSSPQKPQHKPTASSKDQSLPDRKVVGSTNDKQQPDRKTTQSQSSSKDSKRTKKKSQIKETSTGLPNAPSSVPKLEKATPYEFISAWNGLKKSKSRQPYYDLLRQIPASDLSSVISNKLDEPMLNVMVSCVAEYYLPKGEMDEAFQLLKNLSSVERFGTVSMFMSSEDQSKMKSVIDKLSSNNSSIYSVDDIQKLKKDYSIK